jgi:hypothetical protein
MQLFSNYKLIQTMEKKSASYKPIGDRNVTLFLALSLIRL